VSPATKAVSNKSLTSNIATLTTTTAHGYSVGQVVSVTGVASTFNGTYTVTGTPTTTTFTYTKESADVPSAAVSPVGSVVTTRDRRYYGSLRDASDGIYKFFTGATTKPVTSVNFSEAGLAYAPVQLGALTATSGTFSTGITSTAGTNSLKDLTLSGTSNSFGTSTIAGDFTASGNPTFSGNPIFSGTPTFSGTVTITAGLRVQELIEDVVDVTHSSNTVTLDYNTGNIFYLTNTLSANATVAMTNVPSTNGRITTVNLMVPQGATGYIPSTLTVNGTSVTIKWAQGLTPTPTSTSGKIDIFSFTLLYRASAYTAFASINANY
jgi:hypothetical protein